MTSFPCTSLSVCIPKGQQWRTDGISNITYETQEKRITFEMGAFHTVALLQDVHLNMPYQAWELQPTGVDEVDEALLTVTTVFATIQIQIKVLSIILFIKNLQSFLKKCSIITASFIKNVG